MLIKTPDSGFHHPVGSEITPQTAYRERRQLLQLLAAGSAGAVLAKYKIDYRQQKRRVLTFALGARRTLPRPEPLHLAAPEDPGFVADKAAVARGEIAFMTRCMICHGNGAVGAGSAPDLRTSSVPISSEAFTAVVRDGALIPAGMPPFAEIGDKELADISQYLRSRAADLRRGKTD